MGLKLLTSRMLSLDILQFTLLIFLKMRQYPCDKVDNNVGEFLSMKELFINKKWLLTLKINSKEWASA